MTPRVLLLHGLLASSAAWLPLRRELGSSVDVIAPDLLGYGASPRPAGDYTLERVVAHLVPLVERERPTHVLGHSMGGIVALALARELPGHFERVGLAGLPVYSDRGDGLAHLHRRGPLFRALLHSDVVTHFGCDALHQARRAWGPFSPLFDKRRPREVLVTIFDHSRASHSGSFDNIVFAGLAEALAAAQSSPIAALHGARDHSAPIDRVRALAGRHGWDLAVAPTAGHQLVIERPRLTASWIRERLLAPAASTATAPVAS
ncbi:MAG: alpha/beta fold hydrolase [Chloroflexi bacterium]|nr:alpha/beta fold hydrolase [Chloroflexota bacterium]